MNSDMKLERFGDADLYWKMDLGSGCELGYVRGKGRLREEVDN